MHRNSNLKVLGGTAPFECSSNKRSLRVVTLRTTMAIAELHVWRTSQVVPIQFNGFTAHCDATIVDLVYELAEISPGYRASLCSQSRARKLLFEKPQLTCRPAPPSLAHPSKQALTLNQQLGASSYCWPETRSCPIGRRDRRPLCSAPLQLRAMRQRIHP